jgi:hypothetical protein
MHQMMTDAGGEMQSHSAALTTATTLEGVLEACTTHFEAMNLMFDGMDQAVGHMGCMNGN